MPVNVTLTNEEQVTVTAAPVTSTGRPASLDGPLRVSVISGEGTFLQDPDLPTIVVLVSSDNPGDTSYLIEGDADLGEGVTLIQDVVTAQVVGAQAAALGLVVGTPEPK